MLAIKRILILAGLICLASEAVKAQSHQVLQDVFASAVADTGMSFMSTTTSLKPAWAQTINMSSLNSTCLDPVGNFTALSSCLQNEKVSIFLLFIEIVMSHYILIYITKL